MSAGLLCPIVGDFDSLLPSCETCRAARNVPEDWHADYHHQIVDLIRRASANVGVFDEQFVCRVSPLSQLYWRYIMEPKTAKTLHDDLELGQWNDSKGRLEGYCDDMAWKMSTSIVSHIVGLELQWSTAERKIGINW